MTRRPPGPTGHLITGNLAALRRDMLGFWTESVREYGDVVYFRYFHQHHYLLNRPKDIEQVLVTDSRNFIKWRPFRVSAPLFGNGLALSEGAYWKRQRRLAQPAFHPRRIDMYANVMIDHAAELADSWQDGETRDVHREMMMLALKIVCRTLFGADITGDAGRAIQMLADVQTRFEEWLLSGVPLPLSVPTPRNVHMRRLVRRVDAILYRMIAERRAGRLEGDDLLTTLISVRDADGTAMTDRQVRDEVMTFFVAGYETTAVTLAWAWYLVSQHPDVEAALIREVDTVVGGRRVEVTDVAALSYTTAVIKETLRLFPPVYAQGREALRACEVGGYHVPAGTQLFMSQWTVQRDPRLFADPDAFKPERWQSPATAHLPRFAYFPFGGGPRVCLGASFAMTEATLAMATIASRFRLSLPAGPAVRPRAAGTLQPSHALHMRIAARQVVAEV
jgi:cytochrome P450